MRNIVVSIVLVASIIIIFSSYFITLNFIVEKSITDKFNIMEDYVKDEDWNKVIKTSKDLKKDWDKKKYFIMLNFAGKVDKVNLDFFQKDQKWLSEQLKEFSVTTFDQVLLAQYDSSGQFFVNFNNSSKLENQFLCQQEYIISTLRQSYFYRDGNYMFSKILKDLYGNFKYIRTSLSVLVILSFSNLK